MALPRRFLDRIWRRGRAARPGRSALDVAPGPARARRDARPRASITDVLGRHDTMTQRAEAAAVADAYLTLVDDGRRNFFRLLARDFWTDPDAGRRRGPTRCAPRRPRSTAVPPSTALRDALTPPAGRLLRLFTGARRRREVPRRPARRRAAVRAATTRSSPSSTSELNQHLVDAVRRRPARRCAASPGTRRPRCSRS